MKIQNICDIKRPVGTVIFVTGCTGQDGSIMTDYLLANTSASIIGGARRLSVENHQNLNHLQSEPRFQLVNFDLTDSQSVQRLVSQVRPDYFINFAAQSFVAASWDLSLSTLQSNVVGVVNCLEAIRTTAPNCRFYNAGSSEEFGNVEYEPQDETHPLRPRSPYGASKSSARHYVKVYRESYGLYAVQGWLFNHEGPRRGEEFVTRKITKGVAKIFNSIVNGGPVVPIELGNIDAERDWSDAEDMVDAVWRMLNQDRFNNELVCKMGDMWSIKELSKNIKDYVAGSGERHTIREFIEIAFGLVGIKGQWSGEGVDEFYWYESGPKSLSSDDCTLVKVNPKFYRPAEVDILLANSEKIRKELHWPPKTTFEGLIDKMVTNDLKSYDS